MNDDRFRIFHDVNREIAFICECLDPECRSTVVLTPDQYESTRPSLIVHPGLSRICRLVGSPRVDYCARILRGGAMSAGLGLALLWCALLVGAPASADARADVVQRAAAVSWCGSGVATDRLPDAVGGRQTNVVYAFPSDVAGRYPDIAGGIATDVAAMDAWWRREDPTRAPRFDLARFPGCAPDFGSLDISVLRLSGDTAVYEPLAGRYQRLARELAQTFRSSSKKYLVYYDGRVESQNVCGWAGLGPAESGPTFAFVFVNAERCGTLGANDYMVKAAAHELLHTIGAVPLEAPHPCPGNPAHSCDNGFDVMHGLSFGFGGIDQWVLDAGRDDYYGHSGTWWDVQDSRWLRHLDQPARTLDVTLVGATEGATVTSDLPGIECPQACSSVWDGGEKVTLVAAPGLDSRVARWTGGCTGRTDECEVTMDRAQSVSVVFGPLDYLGRVTVRGKGRVTNADVRLSCTRTCSKRFSAGESFAFRAVPAKGWRFAGWKGACSGRSATCRVRFDANRSLQATFQRR